MRTALLRGAVSFSSFEGAGGGMGAGGGVLCGVELPFIFLGKGKWKSGVFLGRKGLPLAAAAAPVLPCGFSNKVSAGEVAVVVQPRFHRFLLRRGGAAALHTPRLLSAAALPPAAAAVGAFPLPGLPSPAGGAPGPA